MFQPALFQDVIRKDRLPTRLLTRQRPIHRWLNFIAGFSPEFVSACIQNAELANDAVIIDPFAGLSTTLVQANIEGIRSVGFEAHPFFYDMSLAKLFLPPDAMVVDKVEAFLRAVSEPYGDLREIWSLQARTFLEKLIPYESLRFLATAVLQTDSAPSPLLHRLLLTRVLELTAHAQTDGIYKAPTTRKRTGHYMVCILKHIPSLRASYKKTALRSSALTGCAIEVIAGRLRSVKEPDVL